MSLFPGQGWILVGSRTISSFPLRHGDWMVDEVHVGPSGPRIRLWHPMGHRQSAVERVGRISRAHGAQTIGG